MERIEDCISFLVGKAAQRIARRSREVLAPHGVTPVQYAVLNVLWEENGQSGAELGARLALDSATITGVLDRMEAGALVERRPDPDGDRRTQRIFLSKKGRALEAPLNDIMDRVNAEIARDVRPHAAQLWALLRQLGSVEMAAEKNARK